MKFLMIALIGGLILTGCSGVSVIAKGVAEYCKVPVEQRLLIREVVKQEIAPNKISVECADN